MDWLEIIRGIGDAPFKAIMVIVCIYGVRQLSQMKESMNKLHTGIAVVVEKVSGHERRITTLERKKR